MTCRRCHKQPCNCITYVVAGPKRSMPAMRFGVRNAEGVEIMTIEVDGTVCVAEGITAQHLAEVLCELFVFPRLNEADREMERIK